MWIERHKMVPNNDRVVLVCDRNKRLLGAGGDSILLCPHRNDRAISARYTVTKSGGTFSCGAGVTHWREFTDEIAQLPDIGCYPIYLEPIFPRIQ